MIRVCLLSLELFESLFETFALFCTLLQVLFHYLDIGGLPINCVIEADYSLSATVWFVRFALQRLSTGSLCFLVQCLLQLLLDPVFTVLDVALKLVNQLLPSLDFLFNVFGHHRSGGSLFTPIIPLFVFLLLLILLYPSFECSLFIGKLLLALLEDMKDAIV